LVSKVKGLEKVVCKRCGSTKNLVYHHISYEPEQIEVICRSCHALEHKPAQGISLRPNGFRTKIVKTERNPTDTELIGVTIEKIYLAQIDERIKDEPMVNRQDFIRSVIKAKLEVTP
jgi:hypothetical protein